MSPSILIIDDEPKMAGILKRVLERQGYAVDITNDPGQGVSLMSEKSYDVILSDLKMPGMDGIEVLKNANILQPGCDFIMMTAFATVDTAIQAMKLGAFDYLIKPFPIEKLKEILKGIMETRSLDDEKPSQGGAPANVERDSCQKIVAESPAMQKILRLAAKVAGSAASVLIQGESGTGKEVMARYIHEQSPRSSREMVCVNCGAIPENLMESELFGHVKGAFTGASQNRKGLFETADGGSIFLDEVGEIPLFTQVKLLRVLQEGELTRVGESRPVKIDVRVIAATNRDLERAVNEGAFRKDLFYRLNVVPLLIPALRKRPSDIPALVKHFLRVYGPADHCLKMDAAAMDALLKYSWPGNVRELENAVEHGVVLCEGDQISLEDLPPALSEVESDADGMAATRVPVDPVSLEDMEKRCIVSALEKSGGNQTRAARMLGITRRTLGYRMRKYGIEN